MNNIRSLAKIPNDESVENPNKLKMNKNNPNRFLFHHSDQYLSLRDTVDHLLESRDITRQAIKEETTQKGNNDSYSIMRRHQEWVPKSISKCFLTTLVDTHL